MMSAVVDLTAVPLDCKYGTLSLSGRRNSEFVAKLIEKKNDVVSHFLQHALRASIPIVSRNLKVFHWGSLTWQGFAGIPANMNVIESSKKAAISGMEMFLRNFSHVPDDKLNWSPTSTSKTPLRIAAHTALYAKRFAQMIRDRKLPVPENLTDWIAKNDAEEVAISTREEMERVFREGTTEVLNALDTLSPEEVEMTLDSGQGWSMPMKQLMGLAGWHATLHCGQIDFLQTCWGDQEVYVG
jgi:uncharacterized damage-inducible protein DinB